MGKTQQVGPWMRWFEYEDLHDLLALYWNLNETSQLQKATEVTEMADDACNALIIAAAPDGGWQLTERDLKNGRSRDQVIELYTNATQQRQVSFFLDGVRPPMRVLWLRPQMPL